MDPNIKRFLRSWLINTLAVLVAVFIVPGLQFKSGHLWTPFVTSLVLGILNAFFRPILMFMALPLLLVTLGLFTLVINALLLYLVGLILGNYFEVAGFGSALLGAIIISFVSLILNVLTGRGNAQASIRRAPPRRRDNGGGGDGPVIDV